MTESVLSPRERVKRALQHIEPDRAPVDFLATPEIWWKLEQHLTVDPDSVGPSAYFDPRWEAILRRFEVDCRATGRVGRQVSQGPPRLAGRGAFRELLRPQRTRQ